LPGDPITGHSPFILIHTDLTDGKPAPTLPAKGKGLIAAMAYARLFPAVPAAGLTNGVSIVTGLHFMSLYINQRLVMFDLYGPSLRIATPSL